MYDTWCSTIDCLAMTTCNPNRLSSLYLDTCARSLLVFLIMLSLAGCGGSGSLSGGGSGGAGSAGGGAGSGGGGGGGNPGNGAFTAGRTKYVRTDATTEYFRWINAHWIVYNPPTNHFFVTDPLSNHVMVMDPASETEVGIISVPGAFSIDDTPDHSLLYVGTLIGDLYAVDPVSMTVTKRYVGSQIGAGGFSVFSAVVLANGELALLGATGGIPSVDGSSSFAIWNPLNNSLTKYDPQQCGALMGNIGGFSRTVDRTKIILTSIDSDATLCEVDETSGQANFVSTGASFTMVNFRTSPDGKYIIVPGFPGGVDVYDAQTLAPVTQFSTSGDSSTASGFFLSADSSTLYTPGTNIIYAYGLATQQPVGWLPNMDVQPTSGGGAEGPISAPNIQATDGTGLFVGPLEEGVGFVDMNVLRTGAVGTQFANGYLDPATGPSAGGTAVQLSEPGTVGALSAMFIGSAHATNLSGGSPLISADTPQGVSGPADVYVFTTDGSFQLLPEGFSYGPTILQVSPNMSTIEGGSTGFIFGYGFGPFTASTSVPNNLQATVGGVPVQLTALFSFIGSPPFQLQILAYTIPAGSVGSADVTVTSSSGSTTVHGALTYLPGIQQFSLAGSSLAQGIYDPHRDLYYFTDTNKVQIFSKTLGSWQTPISIPAPQGATQRLWGLGLSPDGMNLAVADISAGVIYELNPASPSTIKTFSVSTTSTPVAKVFPAGTAISDSGMIYYATMAPGVSGAPGFFKLNTSTGTITDYGIDSPGESIAGHPQDVFLRTVISADNSKVFFNAKGFVFRIDTATDSITPASNDVGCCSGDYDLTVSANQVQFEASSFFYDSNLNAESYYALNDREILTASDVYGAKLSPDGSLLFQPSPNGLDILDGRLGNLLQRVSLPVALSQNYDALVEDGKDNVLIAITGVNSDGIAVVDLSSVSEPPPLPFFKSSSPSAINRVVPGRDPRSASITSHGLNRTESSPTVPRRVVHVSTRSAAFSNGTLSQTK
jgi:hypothetical protein